MGRRYIQLWQRFAQDFHDLAEVLAIIYKKNSSQSKAPPPSGVCCGGSRLGNRDCVCNPKPDPLWMGRQVNFQRHPGSSTEARIIIVFGIPKDQTPRGIEERSEE